MSDSAQLAHGQESKAEKQAEGIQLKNPFLSELDETRLAAFKNKLPEISIPSFVPDSELNKKVLEENQKKDRKKREEQEQGKKDELKLSAGREQIISKLPEPERLRLDLLRLELAARTSAEEQGSRQKEISTLLAKSLGKELEKTGFADLLNQRPLPDLLAEMKAQRPADYAKLKEIVRRQILEHGELAISDQDKFADFKAKLAKFESRQSQRGLPDYESLGTLLQIGRVLHPDTKLAHGNKSKLARDMLSNAADPTSIDQGGHNTCNVTSFQVRLYTQEPAVASKIVADTAIAGKFVCADGTQVKPLSLTPDNEAAADPTPDGLRNHASQIFQMVAINAYWNRRDTLPGGKTIGKGNIQYAQDASGEFLLDTTVDPPHKQKFDTIDSAHPWLDIYGVSEVAEQLTGKPSVNFGIKRWVYSGESAGVTKVVTLGGFKDRLIELKKQNAFPVVIEVDAAKKPFGDDKGFGPHMVSITDYDQESGLVSVDNQWGKGADQTGKEGETPKAPADVLFRSMSLMPSFDYLWERARDGLKQVKAKDSVQPTIAAASVHGLKFGLSASAPLAVRGGLAHLSKWGVPGAGSVLSASETRLGAFGLRAGTSAAAFAAFAYANDLPGAFKQGTAHGIGKLTRVSGDWASFEIGRGLSGKIASFVPWAPARFGISLAGGMASTAVFDKLLGEGSEIGGSWVYDRARDYFMTKKPLPAVEKARGIAAMEFNLRPPNPNYDFEKPSMNALFLKDQKLKNLTLESLSPNKSK